MSVKASNPSEVVWAQKYRPTSIEEVIIPPSFKAVLKPYIEEKRIPSMLFSSPSPGTGKTTTALALCNDIGVRPLFINASLDNSIDDIRTKVVQYATTASLVGGSQKVVVLDEAERLSQAAQESLKGLMETVSKNCSFILTTNNKGRIVEPLISRCTVEVDFSYNKEEQAVVDAMIFKRVEGILEAEGIPFDKLPVAHLVKSRSPDNRKILNEIQRYAKANGKIDNGILAVIKKADDSTLFEAMKVKKYDDVKSWVFDNFERLGDDFYLKVFKVVQEQCQPQSTPTAVLILNQYQRYHNVVPDRFVHFLAMCTELMMELQYK